MSNTILLKGRGHRKEAVAATTISPGMLLTMTSAALLTPHATASGAAAPLFAVENDIIGNEITVDYVANDYVQAEYLYSGCEVLAKLIAGGTAVGIGDLLESGGNGSLRKFTSGIVIAQALAAVDNSGGGSMVNIPVVIL